jgi:pimeloyl-ACP methyl ester carboxylesterase
MDATVELAGLSGLSRDQRNAGRSRGHVAATDEGRTLAHDRLALMDHLGIQRCHTIGGCIGATFRLILCHLAPARVATAVLLNPVVAFRRERRALSRGRRVENGRVVMLELPGIGFEGKSDLVKVMRVLAS